MSDENEHGEVSDHGQVEIIQPVPPRSARQKIEADLKRDAEAPKGLSNLTRREFLKASAITGSMALMASGGLIGGQPTAVAEAAEIKGYRYTPAPSYAPGDTVKVVNGADALIKLLQAYDTKYLFWGTDDEIAPIADKLTPIMLAKQTPIPIMGLNEFAAVAMAHGYTTTSEKVAVAMYGACQGPMNSHGALYNAYMSRAPIVVLSALNADSGLPYCGQYWIDPGDLVREYTKWTNHFAKSDNIPAEVIHGFATAAAHPQGPVLISTFYNTWLDEMPNGTLTLPNPAELGAGLASVPNPTALKAAVDLLMNAKNPVIVAGDLGRRTDAFNQLVKFAELIGAGVVETHGAFTGFPWNHPQHIGFSTTDGTKEADVVFVIETNTPAVGANTKVIQLDVDPVRSHALSSANRLREIDMRLLGESYDTLAAMTAAIGTPSDAFKATVKARVSKWQAMHDKQRADWKAATAKHLDDKPISEWRVVDEVSKLMNDKTTVFGWTYHSRSRVLYPGLQTNYPKSYIYTLGGSHLGQTWYAALGAAVGAPDKQIIAVGGDLEWHMGHGAAALWSGAHHNIPVLYIIVNNHEMSQTKAGQAGTKGEGVKLNNWWAQEIFPPMSDYSAIAKAYGLYGEVVKEPAEVGPALKRAMDAVAKNKQPALLDIWTASIVGVDGVL